MVQPEFIEDNELTAGRDGMMESLDAMRASKERGRKEPVLSAYGEATLRAMEGSAPYSGQLNDVFDDYLEQRPNLRQEYSVELPWRAAAMRMRFSNKLESPRVGLHPRDCNTTQHWDHFYTWLFANPERQIEYESDLLRRQVATNEDQRRVGILIAIKAARLAKPDLLPAHNYGLNIVELGCSTNDILHALIRGAPPALEIAGTSQEKAWFHNLGRVAINRAVGIDFFAPDRLWAEACKRPSEQSDAVLYPERSHPPYWPPNLSFVETDFSSELHMLNFRASREYRSLHIDVSAAIASLYMQTAPEQVSSLAEQKKLGAKMDVIMEWAKVDPKDATKLIFSPSLYTEHALPFGLYIRFEDEMIQLGEFSNGRCLKFKPSATLSEWIGQAASGAGSAA